MQMSATWKINVIIHLHRFIKKKPLQKQILIISSQKKTALYIQTNTIEFARHGIKSKKKTNSLVEFFSQKKKKTHTNRNNFFE